VSFPWEMPLTKRELNEKIKKHVTTPTNKFVGFYS